MERSRTNGRRSPRSGSRMVDYARWWPTRGFSFETVLNSRYRTEQAISAMSGRDWLRTAQIGQCAGGQRPHAEVDLLPS